MKKVLVWIATVQVLLSGFSAAAVVVQLPTTTTAGSIQFTTDVVFNISTTGTARGFYFDNWVTNDGFRDSLDVGSVYNAMGDPALEADLLYTLNGVNGAGNISFFSDNANFSGGAVTAGDGYLWVDGGAVTAGDIFVIKAATYPLAAGDIFGFNTQANQTFTGGMFITDQFNNLIGTSAVPEPTRMSLALLGVSGLLLRRRRSVR